MKDTNKQNRQGKPRSDASEIGVVRVFSNPGPDAEDRLRRLITLMVKYATSDAKAEPENYDAARAEDNAEGEG